QRGAVIAVTPGSVTVKAGMTSTIQVSLTMSAANFAALPSDDTKSVGQGGLITVRGDIMASPAAGEPADHQTLRLPYIFIPRGLSNVTAGALGDFTNVTPTASPAFPGNTLAASLSLSNSGIHTGTADLYAWGIHAPRHAGQTNDVRDVGVQIVPGPKGSPASERGLRFLVNTWSQSASQSVNEFDVVIDTNGDGVADFVLVGADFGLVTTGTADGRYGAFTFNAHTGKLVDAFFADAPPNGSTVELLTLASDLGLSEADLSTGPVKKKGITYGVVSRSVKVSGFVDVTGVTRINPYVPSVSSGDFAILASGGATSFTLLVDPDQQQKEPALGWLVASVDNASGAAQADEVPLPRK
ncbi:MAG TPA: hypothetical protein VJQ08_10260, partial [Candidatus Dormibacteraeota bacterium]|nr:hypothetical protein [Candidatus Dormibacteraeota bacterium]